MSVQALSEMDVPVPVGPRVASKKALEATENDGNRQEQATRINPVRLSGHAESHSHSDATSRLR